MKLPVKIDLCPIEEAIFEIRYSSDTPSDAIFGMLYGAIGKFFNSEPVSLPILQLPEAVRRQDPNLKYKGYHKLQKDNNVLSIGPDVLTFSNSNPYSGWKEWSTFFYEVFNKIKKTNVLDKVERIGLRYINLFSSNIFEKVKCEVKIDDKQLKEESTNLRTEMLDEGFIKVLQIGNSVTRVKDEKAITGSVIDIDILYMVEDSSEFFKNYKDLVEKAHHKEKEMFFSLLNKSFLDEFNPNYGE